MDKVVKEIIDQVMCKIFKKIGMYVELIVVNMGFFDEMIFLCKIICEYWNVLYEWVIEKKRDQCWFIMCKIIWFIFKNKYLNQIFINLVWVIGLREYVIVIKGIKRVKELISVNDDVFMKYYILVKYFINEFELLK